MTTGKPTRGFAGFPTKTNGYTNIPNLFFSELLPQIDDLIEFKITMYCFWAIQQREGDFRYVRMADMRDDKILLLGLAPDLAQAERELQRGLELAATRGTLLHIVLPNDHLYFMNTERGRAAVDAIEKGSWLPGNNDRPISLIVERPNIFNLYEQNIGALTPMLGDLLRDAEVTYPADWIVEAMQIAVESNKRSWRYIEAILKRWATEGRPRIAPPGPTNGEHPYLQDEYFRRRDS